jgi:hypothetical protein
MDSRPWYLGSRMMRSAAAWVAMRQKWFLEYSRRLRHATSVSDRTLRVSRAPDMVPRQFGMGWRTERDGSVRCSAHSGGKRRSLPHRSIRLISEDVWRHGHGQGRWAAGCRGEGTVRAGMCKPRTLDGTCRLKPRNLARWGTPRAMTQGCIVGLRLSISGAFACESAFD